MSSITELAQALHSRWSAHTLHSRVTPAVSPAACDQLVTTRWIDSPTAARSHPVTSNITVTMRWARGDLNPHVLSDTGT